MMAMPHSTLSLVVTFVSFVSFVFAGKRGCHILSFPMPAAPDDRLTPVFALWLVSLVATLGSLFFSEVMRLPPCVLCWYQRIAMYPLIVLTTVALWRRDDGVGPYAWPLVAIGLAISIYHNLLYYHLIPESITPCAQGVSCTERQIEWLGFITIPLLALASFAAAAACLVWLTHRARRQ
jgi:disulfide bond formation protein DsbB